MQYRHFFGYKQADERQVAVLDGFNPEPVKVPDTDTVVSLFRRTAAAYPDRPAVKFNDMVITYRELDSISDRLSLIISEKTAGRCSAGLGIPVVTLLMGRSADFPVMTISVLKSGAAYQPLDPSYPKDRLNFMLRDSGASLLISDRYLYSSVSKKTVQRNTKAFYGALGENPAECRVEKILEAQKAVASKGIGGMPFCAICDELLRPGRIIPGLKAAKFWCQKDDALPFVPFRFLTKLATDMLFCKPMRKYSSYLSSKGVRTSCCVRDWRHGESEFGAVHCMELPLLFGDYGTWKDAPFMQGVSLDEYEAQSRILRSELYSFIRNQ